jgi:peptidoglycan/xylan/chitin deacetylase (PgdA/CDA1 family)
LHYLDYLQRTSGHSTRGLFNLTIDLELAWSRARRGDGATSLAESLRRAGLARKRVPELLQLSGDFSIPLTFAIVGHVAVADCQAHSKLPAFTPHWLGEDWFAIDPRSELRQNPDYFGYDLVQQIVQDSVGHEIASHGFSHVDLADDATTEETAGFEINESFRILSGLGKKPVTFVFPQNRPAFLHLLKECGFQIYRHSENSAIERDQLGLWRFPLGMWVSPRGVSPDEIVRSLQIAMDRKLLVNFWCHLYEFENRQQLIDFFMPIFACIRENQEKGFIEARTMRSVVDTVAREAL